MFSCFQSNDVRKQERPKSTPPTHVANKENEEAPRMRSTNSMGNVATEGESTRNQDTESEGRPAQPVISKDAEALLVSYPSLRRAVHNAAWKRYEWVSVVFFYFNGC